METIIILLIALLPIAILVYYIYHKDKKSPEPTGQLIKAFLFGVLSAPLSFVLSIPLGLIGAYPAEISGVFDAIRVSFFGAAIPEEIMKLLVLWLLLRRNRYFDEKMDGIVYAVCVSMGFAALENVMYLFQNQDNFLSVGIVRALFSVPGHFCFGVLMGYYYSLARFYPRFKMKNRTMTIVAPVLVHGIFDSILFAVQVSDYLALILLVVFVVFCFKMWKYASRLVREHLSRDREDLQE